MKTKVVLSLLVVFMAVGSAVASLVLTEQPIWVKAKLSPTGPIQCVSTGAQCNDQGTETCTIQVASVQVGSNQTTNTYSDASCQTVIDRNEVQMAEQSDLEVYQLF